MDPVEITQTDLLAIIGAKEAEIYALRRQLQAVLRDQAQGPSPALVPKRAKPNGAILATQE